MKIKVTKKHIKDAKRLCHVEEYGNESCCPVALALREKFDEPLVVSGCNARFVTGSLEAVILLLPQKVEEFVHAFDWDRAVKPFTFEI